MHSIRLWPVGLCRNEDKVYLLPSEGVAGHGIRFCMPRGFITEMDANDDQGTKSGRSPNSFKKKTRQVARLCTRNEVGQVAEFRSRETRQVARLCKRSSWRAFVHNDRSRAGRRIRSIGNAAGRAFVHRFSLRSSRTRYRSDSISGFRHSIRSWPVGSCRNEDNVYLLPS